jgi:hypothetical protein
VRESIDLLASRAAREPNEVLSKYLWLGSAIEKDASARRFDVWGESTVIDELTGTEVISPTLFAALHDRAGIEARWPVGNAGLLHVYGYLLSTATTPYGLKRDRWVDLQLAQAYGLDSEAFLPWIGSTTLLERVSRAATTLLARGPTRVQMVGGSECFVALGRESADGPFALAYSVAGKLITTFPVDSPESVLEAWETRRGELLWNAVAPATP